MACGNKELLEQYHDHHRKANGSGWFCGCGGIGEGEWGKGICVMGMGCVDREDRTTTDVIGGGGIPPKLGRP